MKRRNFLQSLLGFRAAAYTLDIEKLLWVPGKLISIPAPAPEFTSISLESWALPQHTSHLRLSELLSQTTGILDDWPGGEC